MQLQNLNNFIKETYLFILQQQNWVYLKKWKPMQKHNVSSNQKVAKFNLYIFFVGFTYAHFYTACIQVPVEKQALIQKHFIKIICFVSLV